MDLKIKLTVIFGCWLLPVLAQRETCPTPCQMGFTCAMVRHGSGPPSPGCISMEEAILLHRAVNGGPSGPGTGMNEGGQVTTMTQAQPFVPVAQRGRAGQIPGMQFLGGSQPLPPTFEQRFGSGLTAPTSQGQWGQPNSLAFPADGARQMPPAMTAGMNGMPGGMPGMMPGGMPGAMPGMMPGVMPGTMPGMMPGGMPGTMPGMMPGGMQGTMPGSMPPGGMPPGAMAGGAGMVPGLPIPPLQQGQTTGFVDPTTGQQAFPGGLNGPSGAVSAASAVHDTHANSNSWHDGSGGSNAGFGGVASHQQPIPACSGSVTRCPDGHVCLRMPTRFRDVFEDRCVSRMVSDKIARLFAGEPVFGLTTTTRPTGKASRSFGDFLREITRRLTSRRKNRGREKSDTLAPDKASTNVVVPSRPKKSLSDLVRQARTISLDKTREKNKTPRRSNAGRLIGVGLLADTCEPCVFHSDCLDPLSYCISKVPCKTKACHKVKTR